MRFFYTQEGCDGWCFRFVYFQWRCFKLAGRWIINR